MEDHHYQTPFQEMWLDIKAQQLQASEQPAFPLKDGRKSDSRPVHATLH